ncbi:MAG: rRNA maturation RNase YbeY [Patescibacteria group bacterium]|nr:rRNA maturation RNase YbeY [Patescibacteria group bacterium]
MKGLKIQIFFSDKKVESECPPLRKNEIEQLFIPLAEEKNIPQKVNLVFVNNSFIRKLNAKFRKINKATDVLSFNYGKEDNQGEIYISVQYLKEHSNKSTDSLILSVKQLIVHGMLHLAGYDHEKEKDAVEMEKLERKILKRMGD